MTRTTNVPASKLRRKRRLKLAKGFTGRNKNTNRITQTVLKKAMANQYISRKLKKRDMRRLWITRIGIAARNNGTTYSALMKKLKDAGILLNRKILSDLAVNDEQAFAHIVTASAQ